MNKKSTSDRLAQTWFGAIFGRIWALWGILLFIVTMLIFFIPFLLFAYPKKDPEKTNRFIAYSRIWMDVWLTLIGCPLTVKGREFFRKGENYIVVCNHNSLIDVPVTSPGIPGGNKTIAKIEYARTPLFGLLYKTGSVLVDRKSEASRRESIGKMKEVLQMGLHMCIYPEGTRNKTDLPLKAFHDGAFRLALDSGKSIIPAILFNSRKVLPADRAFFLWPHRLFIDFLPPVDVQSNDTVDGLKQKVFNIMQQHFSASKG